MAFVRTRSMKMGTIASLWRYDGRRRTTMRQAARRRPEPLPLAFERARHRVRVSCDDR